MTERRERDWTDMAPEDFDRDAPLCLNMGTGPVVIPAEPDEYGTASLFGEEPPARQPGARRPSRGGAPVWQEYLF